MSEHINITFGEGLDTGKPVEGTYPVIINQQNADTYDLVVGETVSIDKLVDKDGSRLHLRLSESLNQRIPVIFTGKRHRQILIR